MARILIVEDHRPAASLISNILTIEGHEPKLARTGEQAVNEVLSDGYDLILLDIGLPGLNGWSLLRIFRALHEKGVTVPPVIVVSGEIDQGDDIKAISMGAQAALLKPFDHNELCRTVAAVLGKSR